jgi:hypothetical protein
VDASAEVLITAGMLDHGFLTDRGLRQIRHDLNGIPPGAGIVVRLGPMRAPDELLLRFLAELPNPVRFVGSWQLADQARWRLTELRAEVA